MPILKGDVADLVANCKRVFYANEKSQLSTLVAELSDDVTDAHGQGLHNVSNVLRTASHIDLMAHRKPV